ncbi:tetratricopeptide repeat protein [Mesobacillus foraminis]|uniref:tetratricopeptide repeat protein n=1 Tax=Mesobacillus foraminis TaxID=279826 RepID=UPI001BE95946|nr:tetratricopeptide repeat protein [Mesobacillus foraminis]MBT2758073.1 tetratricopeptide repeat protein [Mesobacillus foraminis]
MFGFGKKKAKEPKVETTEFVILTAQRKEELQRTISIKKEEIDRTTGEEQAKVYEEIGLAFYELGEEDNAIDSFEKSIQAKKSLGTAYKTLLKLYNKKRAEAAQANDEESLQLYLKKMDQMMQVSKEVTRGVF